jgi:hypothetical protein
VNTKNGFRFEVTTKSGSGYRLDNTYIIKSECLTEALLMLNGEVPMHMIERFEMRKLTRTEKIIT